MDMFSKGMGLPFLRGSVLCSQKMHFSNHKITLAFSQHLSSLYLQFSIYASYFSFLFSLKKIFNLEKFSDQN